jgi:hypothetical protein
MKIDYKKLIPAEIPDDVAYHLVDFFYNLPTLFDGMHLMHVMRHEKAIIDGKVKVKCRPRKSTSGENT